MSGASKVSKGTNQQVAEPEDKRDVTDRAREAFAAYHGLGRQIIDELIAEIIRLRAEK